MSTATQTNLFEVENRHLAHLETLLGEFKAKLENSGLSQSDAMGYVNTALHAMEEYSGSLVQHKAVPGYSEISQIHKNLKDLFEDMNLSLSKEERNNDFLDFDASQILKAQDRYRRELCTLASDHTLDRLNKSGSELLEMARTLNA